MIRTANANFVIFNLGNKKIENAILSRNITGCADHTLSSDTKVNVPNTPNHENKDIPNVMVDLNVTDHGKMHFLWTRIALIVISHLMQILLRAQKIMILARTSMSIRTLATKRICFLIRFIV